MKNWTTLLAASLSLLGCNTNQATEEPTGGTGGSIGGAGPGNGGVNYNLSGGVPGGGVGNVPGGGGSNPGGGGSNPGGGGSNPGSGGSNPGSGGSNPGGANNSGGVSNDGGVTGAGGAGGANPTNVDPVGNQNRAPGFIDLTPPLGAALPAQGTALTPPAPTGWDWYPIDGAICRDGSPTGIFVHKGTVNQLFFFIEGGGACSNVGFCRFNPKSANEALSGDGSTVLGTAAGAVAGRQQPGIYTNGVLQGVFDQSNAANPFKDWNMVYVPYCTGDVHFGTRQNATVPGTPGADARDLQQHQFVGFYNMQKIVARVVPTFAGVTRVVLNGISAGSFGAALNFSMIQDAFVNTPVTLLLDSGIPFDDQYMPVCMQKSWRETWGLAFPPDCTECQRPDGGGLLGMANFLMRKHPSAKVALISSIEDEVIRLFFSVGLQNCANYATADPVAITLAQLDANQYMPAAPYRAGLEGVRSQYASTNRLATYYVPGQLHQWGIRPTFYTTTVGGVTMAQFVTSFLTGTVAQVGP